MRNNSWEIRVIRGLIYFTSKEFRAPGTAHLAITVEEIETWEAYLNDHNVETYPPKFDLYKAKRFFVKDPSGNRIEFLKWLI
ncbi:MAG: hypothetical protein GQ561_00975 [Calditrichae bacterium]|nr:hypothetical protein [Calditrichia bacterium]